jgi:hypothetical protein
MTRLSDLFDEQGQAPGRTTSPTRTCETAPWAISSPKGYAG